MSSISTEVVTLGTVPVAVLATWMFLEASATFGITALWDNAAPLGTFVGIAPTLLITAEQLLRPEIVASRGGHLPIIQGTLLWLVIVALVSQLAAFVIEDSVTPRPDGVEPLAERMPAWLGRGLGLDHARTRDKS